ncbi:MAG TPA: metallophosphoesterase [Pseudonocardiaceae bacterium]|jgi:Icc-related predicted phosphoesterase|nr:metallophosphoesterase [Pseudonocardiaceae bacterium]
MRVHVVSDVHGNADALARAGDGADALVVLGDLLDFVDYHDHSGGILGAVFGAEKVAAFAQLRRGDQPREFIAYARSLWAGLDDAAAVVEEAVREQYAKLFAALTAPTYATPGNVDVPALWPEYAGENVRMLDGDTVDIGGLRFGFVGGSLLPAGAVPRRTGVWVPYLRPEPDYAATVRGLGPVDVLCSHIPPAVPELAYDVVARRAEPSSAALVESIRRYQPRWSLFGHVHQPLAPRVRLGRTECVNVGHFKRTGVPLTLSW